MTANDERILELKRLSNDLEAAAYEMRRLVEDYGNNAQVVDPSTK